MNGVYFFVVALALAACAGASRSPSRDADRNPTPNPFEEESPGRLLDRTAIDGRGEAIAVALRAAILDDGSGEGGPPDPQPPIETDV